MTTPEKICGLFDDLYHGTPWIDVNLAGTLATITAKQAANRVLENCNSIWEINNHLIHWRLNVLQRVQGNILVTPTHNYIQKVNITSEAAWVATLQQLENTQNQWRNYLNGLRENELENRYPINNMTYYEHIHGIIQHDAYHLGQIVLLKKILLAR